MATADEIRLQQEGIQNSETLLDLSNQLNNSITERRKLLKGITAEEQLYFATVKQQQKLSQDIAANAEKYLGYQIKSKDLAKQIKAVEDNAAKSKNAFNNISVKLANDQQKAANEARKLRVQERDLARQILAIDTNTQQLELQKQNALRRGDLSAAQRLQQDIKINQLNATVLEKRSRRLEEEILKHKNIAKVTAETIKNGIEALKAQEKEIAFLKENERIRKRIEKSTGLLGGISKSLSKIPGIGQYLNADEAIAEMEKLAADIEEAGGKATSFSNRLRIGLKGASVLAKGFYENIKSPEAVFTFIVTKAFQANKQVVELGKSLGYGVGRADAFREKLVDIERSSNNLNINTTNLVEAFGQLSEATGFAYEFTADQLETQVKLTKQVGLQADEAAQFQRFAVLNGKTSEETYKSFVRGLTAARNQLRVGINFKATLAEALKVSGQLAANLGFNPELIAKAAVTAKAFGTTLEQVAKSGESLLNFESSIENELKAELLTGRQLNLERARAAALAGDQITLAEELAKNVGTSTEFTKMNVLQQKALAESVGMTADELANTLRKREEAIASGKSLAQITKEEAQQALERQEIQEKFNTALLKVQDVIGNLVAGPFGQLLDLLSNIASILTTVISPIITSISYVVGLIVDGFKTLSPILIGIGGLLGAMYAKSLALAVVDIVKGAWASLGSVPFIGPILATGAILAGVAATTAEQKMGETITSTNIQGFHPDDYVRAFNLFGNKDEYRFNVLLAPGITLDTAAAGNLISTCENRGDSIAIVDAKLYGASVNSAASAAAGQSSNYGAAYWPWVSLFSTGLGKAIWAPASTVMGGVFAFNDQVGAEWFAPAGLNRGGVPSVLRAERKLSQADRDTLYQANVNPLATFPGEGVVVFGQKTLQRKQTALDRVNVRRLLIALKDYIGQVANNLVFEQNTNVTRNRFLSQVNPYMESVVQRQGLFAYKVVMDESNNTPDVIDRNQLVGQIYIQPTKTAEFIILNFNVQPTGATFPA